MVVVSRAPVPPRVEVGGVHEVIDAFTAWVQAHPDQAAVWVTIAITLLGAIVTFGKWAFDRAHQALKSMRRVRVASIRNAKHRNIDEFIELYQSAFPEDVRYSSAETLKWLGVGRENSAFEYVVHLALVNGEPTGLAIAMKSRAKNIVFIPFFALHSTCNKERVSRRIISSFHKGICGKKGDAIVIFELDNPEVAGLNNEEVIRRRSRIRKFREYAVRMGLHIGFPHITYMHPPYYTDSSDREAEEMVLGIVAKGEISTNKEAIYEVLEFIFRDIYLTCAILEGNAPKEFSDFIESHLAKYRKSLPDVVELKMLV